MGLVLTALGMILSARLDVNSSPFEFALYLVPLGLGIGVFNTPNTSAVMGRAPKAQLGVVSSLLSETRTLGQATGVAVLGSFFAFRVQQYAGVGTSIDAASAIHIVQALRDDLLVGTILMVVCLICVLWAWRGSSEMVAAGVGD